MPIGIRWIAGRFIIAKIKGQEVGFGASQFGRHFHSAAANRKVNQGATGERQQRLVSLPFRVGKPIETVLIDRILNTLRKVGLEFGGRDGDAIEEQHQVDVQFVVHGEMDLANDAQAIGGVPLHDVGVHSHRGFELCHLHLAADAQNIEPAPQHVQRATAVKGIPQPLQQRLRRRRPMVIS